MSATHEDRGLARRAQKHLVGLRQSRAVKRDGDIGSHALGELGQPTSPPSKPMINRDGTLVKIQNGPIRCSPIIEFTSKEVRDRFSSAVVEALPVAHPEVLG